MLLTVEQAAQRLQLTPYTVRAQLRQGKLRGIRRGRVWRIEESALLESTPANPARTGREAHEKGFGFLKGKIAGSDEFLKRKHAQAEAEFEREQPETEVAS